MSMAQSISKRDLRNTDLGAVAHIHVRAFPSSAMTKLGTEIVRLYYDWQLNGPHDAYAFGAFENGRCIGFCFGGEFVGATTGFLRKYKGRLIKRVLLRPWLVANSLFRNRLVSGVRLLSKRKSRSALANKAGLKDMKSFGILAIAVDPSYHGRGVGSLLMAEAESIARRRSYKRMHLTVSTKNNQAIRFYKGLGWVAVESGKEWTGGMYKLLT